MKNSGDVSSDKPFLMSMVSLLYVLPDPTYPLMCPSYLKKNKTLFFFYVMSVYHVFMSMTMCIVPAEVRKGCWIPWN